MLYPTRPLDKRPTPTPGLLPRNIAEQNIYTKYAVLFIAGVLSVPKPYP